MPKDHEKKFRSALDRLARKEREEYIRRSSVLFLECAIHLCTTHMALADVADILEEEARILRIHR